MLYIKWISTILLSHSILGHRLSVPCLFAKYPALNGTFTYYGMIMNKTSNLHGNTTLNNGIDPHKESTQKREI